MGRFVTPDQPTLALALADDERGEHEQLEATAEHPFWAEGRGWVGAGSLRGGERVRRADGRWLRVEKVEARVGRRTVYNLEVEDWHTYVVGKLGAWVHNTCGGVLPKILGTQTGLRNPAQVDAIKQAMKAGEYAYKEARGRIAVQVAKDGSVSVTEGHHRMVAALELLKETGNAGPVQSLLRNAETNLVESVPHLARPMPSRSAWGAFRNWLGF